MRAAGVVLAAGSGARMGRPKAEVIVSGRRLIDRAVDSLGRGGCDPVIAVVREGVHADNAVCFVNPDPERGMRSSLELGIVAASRSSDVDAIAVVLVDTPGVDADSVRTVLAGWRPDRVAIGRVDGRRVHPTVMSPGRWHEALAIADADEGARRYLSAHPELVDEIEVAGSADDLDTPDDLAAWHARHGGA